MKLFYSIFYSPFYTCSIYKSTIITSVGVSHVPFLELYVYGDCENASKLRPASTFKMLKTKLCELAV